jgi:hypothetical protein
MGNFNNTRAIRWEREPQPTKRRTSNAQRPTSNIEVREKPIEDEDENEEQDEKEDEDENARLRLGLADRRTKKPEQLTLLWF